MSPPPAVVTLRSSRSSLVQATIGVTPWMPCWAARTWLGRPALVDGAPADLLCFAEDPRSGPAVLSRPDRVILGGRVY